MSFHSSGFVQLSWSLAPLLPRPPCAGFLIALLSFDSDQWPRKPWRCRPRIPVLVHIKRLVVELQDSVLNLPWRQVRGVRIMHVCVDVRDLILRQP